MFEAIGMGIVKTRRTVDPYVHGIVKTRGFVDPDVRSSVKTRGLGDPGVGGFGRFGFRELTRRGQMFI